MNPYGPTPTEANVPAYDKAISVKDRAIQSDMPHGFLAFRTKCNGTRLVDGRANLGKSLGSGEGTLRQIRTLAPCRKLAVRVPAATTPPRAAVRRGSKAKDRPDPVSHISTDEYLLEFAGAEFVTARERSVQCRGRVRDVWRSPGCYFASNASTDGTYARMRSRFLAICSISCRPSAGSRSQNSLDWINSISLFMSLPFKPSGR